MTHQYVVIAKMTNHIVGCISMNVTNRLVRPHLKYCV